MSVYGQYLSHQNVLSKATNHRIAYDRCTSYLSELLLKLYTCVGSIVFGARSRIERLRKEDSGQGTTEYAILVGVLVVIAIAAIILFRSKVQELWDAIVAGFNSL